MNSFMSDSIDIHVHILSTNILFYHFQPQEQDSYHIELKEKHFKPHFNIYNFRPS